MSSCARSMPSLRAAQSFTASAVKQPVRRLHITGAKEQPSQYLKPAAASSQAKLPKADSPTRTFNTTRALKRPNDTSTIDFAFMPTHDSPAFAVGSVSTAALNIPILPDNYRAAPVVAPVVSAPIENIVAEVETVSMSLPGQVAVMSESDVGATHEGNAMDVFKMVETITRKVEDVRATAKEEAGVMREVVAGMLGDLVGGSKRVA